MWGKRRLSCLLLGGGNVGENAHDVALLHDQELLVVDLDFSARPFAEQHAVADLEVDRKQLAGFVAPARANCDDLALRGLFLRGVRNDDAASCLLFGVDALDHDAVVKRTEFHGVLLKCFLVFWGLAVAVRECYWALDIGRYGPLDKRLVQRFRPSQSTAASRCEAGDLGGGLRAEAVGVKSFGLFRRAKGTYARARRKDNGTPMQFFSHAFLE